MVIVKRIAAAWCASIDLEAILVVRFTVSPSGIAGYDLSGISGQLLPNVWAWVTRHGDATTAQGISHRIMANLSIWLEKAPAASSGTRLGSCGLRTLLRWSMERKLQQATSTPL